MLDNSIRAVQIQLRSLVEDTTFSKYTFVTHDDIRLLPSMSGQTLIAIKAPAGTRLEVPDPDEGMTHGKRRYQIYLRSESGAPIDVYLVSSDPNANQVEEDSETALPNQATTNTNSEFNDTDSLLDLPLSNAISTPVKMISDSDISLNNNTSNNNNTLLKLPSPVPVDPDYYLNTMYQSEGISDFYSNYEETSVVDGSIVEDNDFL